MFKKADPKLPSDYQTLRIRMPRDIEVKEIMDEVEKVRASLNRRKSPQRKVWMGNHVLLEAIKLGLKDLKKQNSKLKTKAST